MKEFFKKINLVKFIMSFMLIVLGLCLICMPHITLLSICYLTGGFALFFGLCRVVNFFLYGYETFSLTGGLISLSIGGLILGLAPQITSPQVFSLIVGIMLLISTIFKFQNSINYFKFGVKNWWVYLIYTLLLFIFSIILFVNPFDGQTLFLICLGSFILVDGIFKLVMSFIINSKLKQFTKDDDENIIDV